MKIGDSGEAVLAFQRSVFPADMCDGDAGRDTVSRWQAANDNTLPWPLQRAFSYIGRIITYSMANPGPNANDCSGFICLAFGITKGPDSLVHWWKNTDGILRDAFGQDAEFHDLGAKDALSALQPGDLVCYGGKDGHVGHIAMVVDPVLKIVVDCSSSHNGVHVHEASYFWTKSAGRPVYALRYVGPKPVALAA